MPEARDITDELITTGVVFLLGGSEDDPQDPVVRLRGKKPKLSPAQQRHLLTLPGRAWRPARWQDGVQEAVMDFPETDPDGAPRIRAEQVIRGDVCRYLEICDDGTVHTSKDLTAHRKDQGDWWDRHLNPITDQVSGRVATYLVRPRRQDPPTAPLVFALDVAGTRYTGDGQGWLLAEFEPGRYRAVGQAPVPGRAEYPATQILAWDEADVVAQRHQDQR